LLILRGNPPPEAAGSHFLLYAGGPTGSRPLPFRRKGPKDSSFGGCADPPLQRYAGSLPAMRASRWRSSGRARRQGRPTAGERWAPPTATDRPSPSAPDRHVGVPLQAPGLRGAWSGRCSQRYDRRQALQRRTSPRSPSNPRRRAGRSRSRSWRPGRPGTPLARRPPTSPRIGPAAPSPRRSRTSRDPP
jgi:hypothetical protein